MEPVDLEDESEGVGESQQDDQRDQEDTTLISPCTLVSADLTPQ